jgi:hypothetical protein
MIKPASRVIPKGTLAVLHRVQYASVVSWDYVVAAEGCFAVRQRLYQARAYGRRW